MTQDPRQCRYCPAVLKDYRARVAHEMHGHPDEYEDNEVDEAQVCRDYTAEPPIPVHEIRTTHRIASKRLYAILEAHGVPRRTRSRRERARPGQRNPPMVKRYPQGGVTPWRELLA